MAKSFEELLEEAKNPGEDGPSPTIYDDLGAAYNNTRSGADAEIKRLAEEKAAADAELEKVRAHNYQLLTAIPTGNPSTVSNGSSQETEETTEPEITLDDIITYG